MEMFIKIYIPVFFLLFIAWVFVIPSLNVYKKTGVNPFRFISNEDSAYDFLGVSMKVFIGLLFIAIAIFSFSETAYQYLAPFHYLEADTLKVIGLALGHFGFIGIKIAQSNMKMSWRIGIDYENKTELVTTGFYRFSRNPIYLFLIICLIGLFLVLPNAFTLAVVFAAYLILQVTMRLEEEFLLKQHGDSYTAYKKNVPRIL